MSQDHRGYYILFGDCSCCERTRMCVHSPSYGFKICRDCVSDLGYSWDPISFHNKSFWHDAYDRIKEESINGN